MKPITLAGNLDDYWGHGGTYGTFVTHRGPRYRGSMAIVKVRDMVIIL